MQVSVESTDGLERRMTVSLPAADIDVQIVERLKKAQKTVAINGFRKGKVPMNVLRQRFGASVRQEVLGELVNKSYAEALVKEDIRPLGQPRIEPFEDGQRGDEFSYTAVFEVPPKVELGDLSTIEVEKAESSVEGADIDEMLETLRRQSATFETVDRAAAEGDTVVIDFEGSVDGEAFSGSSARGRFLALGSDNMIPGFESGIVGMHTGETRKIEVRFPKDYEAQELRGRDAVFAITLGEVQESSLPEIDDEFMAKFDVEGGDMGAFRAEIKTNMERELDNKALSYVKNQVMDALVEQHDFDLPLAMVKEELVRSKRELVQQYGRDANIDLSQLPDELFVEQVNRRVKLGLIISELVGSAELSANAETVKAEIAKMASTYEKPEAVEQYYYGNEKLFNSIQMKVLEDQVVKHVLSVARVKTVKLSYADLMAKD